MDRTCQSRDQLSFCRKGTGRTGYPQGSDAQLWLLSIIFYRNRIRKIYMSENFLRFDKGLSSDNRQQVQPGGTVPFAKNGIRPENVNQNEPGFILSSAVIPYTPIGVIETSKFPVIFSTDNTNSALGYYDPVNDVYIPIANDANYPYKLGFKTDFPINGQAQKNYKNEVVIAFTDFNTFPKYMNCDVPVVGSLDDWRLFPLANIPTISVDIVDGGTLFPGAPCGAPLEHDPLHHHRPAPALLALQHKILRLLRPGGPKQPAQ